jgi:hypothetical protein
MARESARAQSGAAGGWEWPDTWAQAAAARKEDPSGHGEPSIYMRTQCGGSADVAAAGCKEAREPSGSGADERQHNARVRRAKEMHAVRGRQPEMHEHMGRVGGAPCRHMRVCDSGVKHSAQELGGHKQSPGVKDKDGWMGWKEIWREDKLEVL